jgi:hypothetical protein
MEYLCNLNLSPKREAMYKAILLEEEIDEQVLRLMDAPPIAEDIAAQTSIPLAISRRLVDDARSVLSGNIPAVVLPHSPPDEHPPRSPSAYSDSPSAYSDSSSSSDESEEEQPANSDYPRIRSPQALSSLVRFIHSAVDEAAEHADAEKNAQQRAAAALQEESDRLMDELRLKNERQQQKQHKVIQTFVCTACPGFPGVMSYSGRCTRAEKQRASGQAESAAKLAESRAPGSS